jgi:hypothetical protein
MVLAAAVALLACSGDGEPRDGALLARPADGELADAMVSSGASARRVADYELTEDGIERWFAADAAMAALAEEDSAVARRLAAESGPGGERDPIRRAVAHLAAIPEASEALDEAGMTPYDFVLTGLALHQALLATGPGSSPALRRLAARNSAFVERHADVLARYTERRPRYVASGEPDPADAVADSVAWLDSVDAAGSVVPDSAYPVDTAMMPPPDTAFLDTLVPELPPPPAAVPDTLSSFVRPPVPEPAPVPPVPASPPPAST